MTTTEHVVLQESVALYDEMATVVDERTRQIVDRRRRTAVIRGRGWLVRRMLLLADVSGLVAAFLLAELITGLRNGPSARVDTWAEFLIFAISLPGWLLVAKIYGLYDRDEEKTDHSTADDVVDVFHMITVGAWIFYGTASLTSVAHPSFPKLALFWFLAIALVSLGRVSARSFCRRQLSYIQNAVIVGAGEVGQLVAKKLLNHPEYGINLIGFLDAEPKERRDDLQNLTVLGPPERLPALVRLLDVERVIVAFSKDSHNDSLDLIRSLKDLDVQIDIVPRLFEVVGPSVAIHTVEGLALVGLPPPHLSRSTLLLKRTIDLVLSSMGLLVLAPVLAYIAVRVKLDSPGPVFYRHERVGRDGKPFRLFKFRTMRLESCRGAEYGGESAESEFQRLMDDPSLQAQFDSNYKLVDDPRVTRVGRVLRRTSLDELPQLFNVVLGQMGLVGPRPITSAELSRYGDSARVLLNARPGVTGYWQINGRSEVSYEERVRLDLAYLTSWSVKLDLLILAKTIRALVSSPGAY